MEGRVPVYEAALVDHDVGGQDVSQVPVRDQLTDRPVDPERHGSGHDLGHQVRPLPRCVQHLVGLGGVHRHPGLGQDVLAGVERGEHHRPVHVRPCPDAYGVGVVGVYQILPVVVYDRDAVLVRDSPAGRPAPVGDADQLDSVHLPEARNVAELGVVPGPYQSYADRLVRHAAFSLLCSRSSFADQAGG